MLNDKKTNDEWIDLFNNIQNKELYNLVTNINSNLDLAKQTLMEMAVYEDDLFPIINDAGDLEYRINNTIGYVNSIDIPKKYKDKIISLLTEDLKSNKSLYPNN